MKYSALFILAAFLLFNLPSCKKQEPKRSKHYFYQANPSYTGTHPVAGLECNIHITDMGSSIEFRVEMTGADISKNYKLHIHSYESALPYFYSGNPVIDLGNLVNGNAVTKQVEQYTFDEFTQNFRGYFIVHDPDNVNNDTTTLLIFGKTGSAW